MLKFLVIPVAAPAGRRPCPRRSRRLAGAQPADRPSRAPTRHDALRHQQGRRGRPRRMEGRPGGPLQAARHQQATASSARTSCSPARRRLGNSVLPTDRQVERQSAYLPAAGHRQGRRRELAEFMAQADRNFARCDLDKDGRINTAECRQALQRRRTPVRRTVAPKAASLAGGTWVSSIGVTAGASAALGVHDVAEQFPGLALEALQLDRLDRIEVGRAGADGDARQQQRQRNFWKLAACFITFSRVRLSPHFFSVSCIRVRDRIGEDVGRVRQVGAPACTWSSTRATPSCRHCRPTACRWDPSGRPPSGCPGSFSKPAGFMTMATLRRHVVEVLRRLPADVGRLADRLRGELRRRDVEEDVGAGILELDDLAVDRRIGRPRRSTCLTIWSTSLPRPSLKPSQ